MDELNDRQLLQEALNTFEWLNSLESTPFIAKTEYLEALRTRLAQPEPELVAWISPKNSLYRTVMEAVANGEQTVRPLYTAQPEKEWVGLTDEERRSIIQLSPLAAYLQQDDWMYDRLFEIEAMLKEKNT